MRDTLHDAFFSKRFAIFRACRAGILARQASPHHAPILEHSWNEIEYEYEYRFAEYECEKNPLVVGRAFLPAKRLLTTPPSSNTLGIRSSTSTSTASLSTSAKRIRSS